MTYIFYIVLILVFAAVIDVVSARLSLDKRTRIKSLTISVCAVIFLGFQELFGYKKLFYDYKEYSFIVFILELIIFFFIVKLYYQVNIRQALKFISLIFLTCFIASSVLWGVFMGIAFEYNL